MNQKTGEIQEGYEEEPYIEADQKLPELTVKAVLLGALLSVILASANAYFGLFAGMTVSASIPAAVISMAVLRLFKNANILENNLVQTAASAGESLAAGVIFTIPALAIMGYWQSFNYFETTVIALSGGILGVLFTIPLRRALIIEKKLKYPEGIATSEVLKSGAGAGKNVKYLFCGGCIGAAFKICDTALNLWHGIFEKAALVSDKIYLYYGMNLSPALIGIGYIVGMNIACLVFMGGAISWYLAIPVYIALYGAPEAQSTIDIGSSIWSNDIRYLGVGAMIVGGLWTLISIRKPLGSTFKSGIRAFRAGRMRRKDIPRTEVDMPMIWVILGIGVMIFPVFFIYSLEIRHFSITVFMAIIMVIAGFLFSAIAGYMAGLVGSSNNPISGVTIATILFASLLLAALITSDGPVKGAAGAIFIGAVVACAAAIAGDNMQDLKAGNILGATPVKQQAMQIIGVVAGSLVIAPVLNYLLHGYGIGAPTEVHPESLAAPQATLMKSVAVGIFGGDLPWTIICIGMGLGCIIILADQYLEKMQSEFRTPVLAVAVGLYLPLELDTTIFIGGVLAWLTNRYMKSGHGSIDSQKTSRSIAKNAGLLFASGLITGEALMGIIIAVAIVVGDINWFRIFKIPPAGSYPGLSMLIVVSMFLMFIIRNVYKNRMQKYEALKNN